MIIPKYRYFRKKIVEMGAFVGRILPENFLKNELRFCSLLKWILL